MGHDVDHAAHRALGAPTLRPTQEPLVSAIGSLVTYGFAFRVVIFDGNSILHQQFHFPFESLYLSSRNDEITLLRIDRRGGADDHFNRSVDLRLTHLSPSKYFSISIGSFTISPTFGRFLLTFKLTLRSMCSPFSLCSSMRAAI